MVNYTSGPNAGSQDTQDSSENVFVYDISNLSPVQKQVIQVPNTYAGIAFDPSGTAFYVSGGVDDNVHIYGLGQNQLWSEQPGSPVRWGIPQIRPLTWVGWGWRCNRKRPGSQLQNMA